MKSFLFLLCGLVINITYAQASASFTQNVDISSINWTYHQPHWEYDDEEYSPSVQRSNLLQKITSETKIKSGILRCFYHKKKKFRDKQKEQKKHLYSLKKDDAIWFEINFHNGLIAVKLYQDKTIHYAYFEKTHIHSTKGGHWKKLSKKEQDFSHVFSTFAYTVSDESIWRFVPAFIIAQTGSVQAMKQIVPVDIDYTRIFDHDGTYQGQSMLNHGYNLNDCEEVKVLPNDVGVVGNNLPRA